jgi:hypothetical protein
MINKMEDYERAREFALNAHGNQPYGHYPYGKHLQDVVTIVEPYGDEAVMVAWLHDVVEDTKTPLSDIVNEFGQGIADQVALVTDCDGRNRKTRKQKTNEKLEESGVGFRIARIVKAADRLANVRFSVYTCDVGKQRMYQDEYAAFRAAVYRPGECNPIWAELDVLIGYKQMAGKRQRDATFNCECGEPNVWPEANRSTQCKCGRIYKHETMGNGGNQWHRIVCTGIVKNSPAYVESATFKAKPIFMQVKGNGDCDGPFCGELHLKTMGYFDVEFFNGMDVNATYEVTIKKLPE